MSPAQQRAVKRAIALLALAALILTLGAKLSRPADEPLSRPDVILVLAGGVDKTGKPHCSVTERLIAAGRVSKDHGGVPIVLNGGGTTWKPRFTDVNGYAIPEAALMAAELERMTEIDEKLLYPEGMSDDTIGNAFFARVMHVELRPEWRDVMVITSQFQMARTRAIYDWIFGLMPRPHGRQYRLAYEAVPDDCLDKQVLAMREAKEADSLQKFTSGPLVGMTTVAEVHEFIFHKHGGYTARGVMSKKPLDSKLADTY